MFPFISGSCAASHELVAACCEIGRVGVEEGGGEVISLFVVLPIEKEEGIAVFILFEVVGVLDVFAVFKGCILVVLVVVVGIGKLALSGVLKWDSAKGAA